MVRPHYLRDYFYKGIYMTEVTVEAVKEMRRSFVKQDYISRRDKIVEELVRDGVVFTVDHEMVKLFDGLGFLVERLDFDFSWKITIWKEPGDNSSL